MIEYHIGPNITAPSKFSAPAAWSGAPGKSPKRGSGQLAGPRCATALPDPRCRPHGQSTRRISEAQEWAARRPWMRCSLPDPQRRPRGQSTRRISEARERAARRPWMRCSLPDPQRRPRGQSTRRISEAKERAARGPGCAAASRILAPSARSEHQADPRIPGAAARGPWVCCRPFRILATGRTV